MHKLKSFHFSDFKVWYKNFKTVLLVYLFLRPERETAAWFHKTFNYFPNTTTRCTLPRGRLLLLLECGLFRETCLTTYYYIWFT